MAAHPAFDYAEAFDRNIGWVTAWEQQQLRARCVAIAGMGGVGGIHLVTLARLGIGGFRIADFDRFDQANFNRQAGATMSTLGRPKVEVMAEAALDINPELRLQVFPEGVTDANLDAFLDGADLFVDGIDFFALPIRRRVFARCADLGIPAVTAAPIGMGAGFVAFVPGGMTFEQYFRLEGQPETEQHLRFLMGMAPRGLHRGYLVDPSRLDLAGRRGPSTVAACQLCAGITAVAALKLLLGRGDVQPAPVHHHFDPYVGRLATTRLQWGNAGPVQRRRLDAARSALAAHLAQAPASDAPSPADAPLHAILDAARWAPSGDNAQTWRFQVVGPDEVVVHLATEAGANVYEYRGGEPSLLSGGMLLESLRIAATAQGRGTEWTLEDRPDDPGAGPYRIRVRFPSRPGLAPDPLLAALPARSVDRRPYRLRRLERRERGALEAALGPEMRVDWHEGLLARRRFARLGQRATDIRLRIREAFQVHQRVIDWTRRDSPTGIPAAAIGLDPLTLRTMRWAMRSWERMHRLNRLTGTAAAAVQLDLGPGLRCAGFFCLRPVEAADDGDRPARLLRAGEAIQRFWLTATALGLALQPNLATLIFAHYGKVGAPFTEDPAARAKAASLAQAFREVTGAEPDAVLFLGRIGQPPPRPRQARSGRRSMSELMQGPTEGQGRT